MSQQHRRPEDGRERERDDHAGSLWRGGAVGIALVAAATAGLVAVAAVIALIVAALY